MPLELCNKCGGFHYSRDACPPKRSTQAALDPTLGCAEKVEICSRPSLRRIKSTAALMEVLAAKDAPRRVASGLAPDRKLRTGAPEFKSQHGVEAGTQAPPVEPKRKVGRPKTIDNMRAYKALKAKEYRERDKTK